MGNRWLSNLTLRELFRRLRKRLKLDALSDSAALLSYYILFALFPFLFALVALGYMWCRMAEIALSRQGGDNAAFYETKLACARFFIVKLLPESNTLFATLTSGGQTLMAMPADAF